MKIVSTNVYVGPNIYAHFPVIRHVLDLGVLEEWPTGKLGETFVDPLLELLPGLHEHGCSYREPGGFVRRTREGEGTWLGHVMEHIAIELQNVAGSPVTFGRTRSIDGSHAHYNMVFQYLDAEVGREASRLSLDLIHSLLPDDLKPDEAPPADWNFDEERDEFIRYAQARAFGPSTASLVRAAEERDIPWIRLNRASLVQFGHGRYQQRIQATTTTRTSNIAVELAGDKEETNNILRNLGLPVPTQRLVRRSSSNRSPAITVAASRSISRRRKRSRSPSTRPATTVAALSSRASSTVTITGCWSSTASSWRRPSACLVTLSATASSRSRSWWISSIRTRVAASATRKC